MIGLLGQAGGLGWFEEHLVRLVDVEPGGMVFTLLAVAVAGGVGMVHGLAPGHGKAIAAAYLVGSRGRSRDAVALGGIVAAMHTGSVMVLGLGLYLFTRLPAGTDRVAPIMTLVAGLLVLAVGVGLVVRQVRAHRASRARAAVGAAGHGHDHLLPDGVSPLSRRGLVLLGVSGGLLPSPSAFLVLTTALFTGRAAFGFLLVTAFSLGLALTLIAVGLATLRGRDVVSRRAASDPRVARVAAALPLVSAMGVLVAGAWVSVLAVLRF